MQKFIQGYCCALSCIVKSHGSDVSIEEALENCGLTSIENLRKHKVDEYDIDNLKEPIKAMQSKIKRKRMRSSNGK